MTSLRLEGVVRGFGGEPVLTGVDLQVEGGECVALLGASGSGKSTLLRLICGLDTLDAGEIHLGADMLSGPGRQVPAERRNIGMVFQDGLLFPFLSVARNVGFGLPREQRKGGPRVDEMLDLVGLSGYGERDPATLSGGERQRVALARALAPAPNVVLLDEPLSNLDASLRAHLRAEIRRIIDDTGVTSIIVTHDRDEAFELGDRVAVLHDGRVGAVGTPAAVYEAPPDEFVARATGTALLMDVVVEQGVVLTPWGGREPLGAMPPDGRHVMVLRPEHLDLAAGSPAPAGTVPGRVRRVAYGGATTLVEVDLEAGSTVEIRHLGPPRVRRGESVSVGHRGGPVTLLDTPTV